MYYQNVSINEESTSDDEPVDEINDFLNRVEKFTLNDFSENQQHETLSKVFSALKKEAKIDSKRKKYVPPNNENDYSLNKVIENEN